MSVDHYLEQKDKRKGGNIMRNLSAYDTGWKYKKVRCQRCQKVVEYVPKRVWTDGSDVLHVGCGLEFRRLTDLFNRRVHFLISKFTRVSQSQLKK